MSRPLYLFDSSTLLQCHGTHHIRPHRYIVCVEHMVCNPSLQHKLPLQSTEWLSAAQISSRYIDEGLTCMLHIALALGTLHNSVAAAIQQYRLAGMPASTTPKQVVAHSSVHIYCQEQLCRFSALHQPGVLAYGPHVSLTIASPWLC